MRKWLSIGGRGILGWACGCGIAAAVESLPTVNLLENDRISIFAERDRERAYAERFAEAVYEAAYATTGESAGKGLVIIGNYDDPHPILLFKTYLDVAEATPGHADGPLFGVLLDKAVEKWEEGDQRLKEEIGMDIESVAYVIPMPLEPAVLNLYLAAREEAFDAAAVEERYRGLKPSELRFGDFEAYDWVIYLPPRNAIDRAIKDVLPHVMKREKMGFFKRSLVKGAVFTFRPVIRDAMEGVRKALLYEAILKATSDLTEAEIDALAEVYRDALMPRGRVISGNKDKRSLEAIRAQLEG